MKSAAFVVAAVSLLGSAARSADDPRLAVRNISPLLRQDAPAVVRLIDETFEAEKDGTGTYRSTVAITIFRESARDLGRMSVWYGGFQSVEEFEGVVLDADGEEVKELEDEDILDISAFGTSDLVTDVRRRTGELFYDKLPYTVVMQYELELESGLQWPSWEARASRYPVERSRFTVRHPASRALRRWTNADTLRPAVSADGSDSVFVWEVFDQPLLTENDSWSRLEDICPVVRIAAATFELDGFEGHMDSWAGLGTWYGRLAVGRQELPPDAVEDVRRLTAGVADTRDKVRAVYRYLQDRTRYVSVQLGIGGWQPLEAAYVHTRQWGDCKALTNYMVSLLSAADLTAYPVLVRSGQYRMPMLIEFPSNQFNHVIVCVPDGKDSIWLECTSQTIPFGMIGADNEDRPGLLIGLNGGVVVSLPVSAPEENLQVRTADIVVKSDGSASAAVSMLLTGNQQRSLRLTWTDIAPDKREHSLLSSHGLGDGAIRSVVVSGVDERRPDLAVQAEADLRTYGSRSANRLFIPLDPFGRTARPPSSVTRWLSPVKFSFRWLDIDTIRIALPPGFIVEGIPTGAADTSSFGSYSIVVSQPSPADILVVRRFRVHDVLIPLEKHDEYRRLYTTVARGDRLQVVLRRGQ